MNQFITTNYNKRNIRIVFIDDVPYWVCVDVCKALGYENTTNTIKALDKDDLRTSYVIDSLGRNVEVNIMNEFALYDLVIKATKNKEAKKFKKWVTHDVLPSIRKTGRYCISGNDTFTKHLQKNVQIENSKKVNATNYENGGIEDVIKYNTENCKIHSGLTPNQIKKKGRETGLKKSECNSAKAVLRKINPEVACSMSFADSLKQQGYDLDIVSPITKDALKLYDKLIKIGYRPVELDRKENK
jgi:prophage antirepressor-like protein